MHRLYYKTAQEISILNGLHTRVSLRASFLARCGWAGAPRERACSQAILRLIHGHSCFNLKFMAALDLYTTTDNESLFK